MHGPDADLTRRIGIRELCENGWWDEDSSVEPGEQFHGLNQDKIIERRGIGDNQRHLRAEMSVGLAVALEVFQTVLQLNAVVLQEGVDLHTGVEAKQAAQLGSRDLASTVGFEGQGLQGGARQVLALGGDSREEFIWKRNGHVLHVFRIPEESLKSTNRGRRRSAQAVGATAEEGEEAEVSKDLELLADFVADVGVVGMEFGQGGGVSVNVGENEFEFA